MRCFVNNPLERRTRKVWCTGGPAMPISEVAFEVFMTVEGLRGALSHIHDLSYVTIRLAGLEQLFLNNSSEARALGFLVDGDVFAILNRDFKEMERLVEERERLLNTIIKR
jgi:hypothetical protein